MKANKIDNEERLRFKREKNKNIDSESKKV